jgi:hypothetical protein
VAKRPGGRRALIIVVILAAFLGVVLFAVRNNASAADLKVGDCFNVPNGTTVQTVETRPCGESHTAEVIFVGDHDGTTFPISLSLDRFVEDNCVPAFEGYTGRSIGSEPALAIGYFHPTRDGWEGGDRTITCYVGQSDERPSTGSLRK